MIKPHNTNWFSFVQQIRRQNIYELSLKYQIKLPIAPKAYMVE